jgi:hypothetical protein
VPTPSGASPDGFATLLPALAAILVIVAVVVVIFHLPGVKQSLDRAFGTDDPPDASFADSTADGTTDDPSAEGAEPFPGFDPSIYGQLPDPSPGTTSE